VAVAVSAVVLLLGLSCFLVLNLTGAISGLGNLFASATPTATQVTITIPSFKGMTITAAQAQATKDNLTVTVSTVASDTVPKDQVIDQNPEPGNYQGIGTSVTLTVSGGPNTVKVPDVVGQQGDTACALLNDTYHLLCNNQGPEASSLPAGEVTRTEPPAGTSVPIHSTVQYWISLGPPTASPTATTPTPTATPCPTVVPPATPVPPCH
jgi:serine/threonine-protein kinase